jgi:hypothetical protein
MGLPPGSDSVRDDGVVLQGYGFASVNSVPDETVDSDPSVQIRDKTCHGLHLSIWDGPPRFSTIQGIATHRKLSYGYRTFFNFSCILVAHQTPGPL